MADLTQQINEARQHGYSDDDIVGYLGSSHPDLAPKIKEAQAGGYQSSDIVGHLTSAPAPGPNPSMNATISAQPHADTMGGKISQWAQNVASDIKYGTDLTGVGTVLKRMGAHGVYSGNSQQVGDFMASLPLGLLRSTQGAGEVANGQPGQGAKDIVGGVVQASQIPAAFVGPEASAAAGSEAGTQILRAAGSAAHWASEAIPTVTRAGHLFSEVEKAAGSTPVDLNAAWETAARVRELAQRGAAMPKVMRDFIKRAMSDDAPMSYAEARDFYSNATRIAADEQQRLTPVMRAQVAIFTQNLGNAIREAANYSGKLPEYDQAMKLYRQASQINKLATTAGRGVLKYVLPGAIGTGTAMTAYDLMKGGPGAGGSGQ